MVRGALAWVVMAIVGLAGCGAPPLVEPAASVLESSGEAATGDVVPLEEAAVRPPSRGGLFEFLRRPADPAPAVGVAAPSATAPPEPIPVAVAPDPPARGLFGRLFGGGSAGPSGVETAKPEGGTPGQRVMKGTVLPFGTVAAVCDLSRREMGKTIDKFPKEGRARWSLHDPIPNSTGPRTQYITGFNDRCARQVTGALVLFGNANVHETTRYAKTNTRPYNATDQEYERVKSGLCSVRSRVPCPADRYARLARSVSFVTVYARFGATSDWYELLLVDGELAAAAMSGL